MKTKSLLILIPSVLLSFSCKNTNAPETPKIPINIATSVTRVTDNTFDTNDAVGLYVVNQPNTLAQSGNHADNVKFTYNGTQWVAANQIYWLDAVTPADFYVYYPYSTSASVTNHSFSVQQDQSTEAGYKASEFLYGNKKDVSPTSDPVLITAKHLMSCIRIELKAGTGWTEAELADASVTITGLNTSTSINLTDGSTFGTSGTADIKPLSLGERVYKALVVPQVVTDKELIKITIGDYDYALKTSVTLSSGKQHKCTITVNRTSEGINIGIDPWEDGDEISGTV